jgi:hypothetical protein
MTTAIVYYSQHHGNTKMLVFMTQCIVHLDVVRLWRDEGGNGHEK